MKVDGGESVFQRRKNSPFDVSAAMLMKACAMMLRWIELSLTLETASPHAVALLAPVGAVPCRMTLSSQVETTPPAFGTDPPPMLIAVLQSEKRLRTVSPPQRCCTPSQCSIVE